MPKNLIKKKITQMISCHKENNMESKRDRIKQNIGKRNLRKRQLMMNHKLRSLVRIKVKILKQIINLNKPSSRVQEPHKTWNLIKL